MVDQLDQMVLNLVDKFSNNPKVVDQVLRAVYALPSEKLRSIDQKGFNILVAKTLRASQATQPTPLHHKAIGILHPGSKTNEQTTETAHSTDAGDTGKGCFSG